MSTETLSREDVAIFTWSGAQRAGDYVTASYEIETSVDPELAAIAMAKEQSLGCARLKHSPHVPSPDAAARVQSVEVLGKSATPILPQYRLTTEVYPHGAQKASFSRARVTIAFPLVNMNGSLTLLWNAVFGEIPRLGYLNTVRLIDLLVPDAFLSAFPGPRHGMNGLRELINVHGRPILCRSTRPAVGMSIEAMSAINEQVLRGGFDAVKDDELAADCPAVPFRKRVEAFAETTRRAEQTTGERKLYFANIIDDLDKTEAQLRIAEEVGADGLIVAPSIQGLAFAQWIASRTDLAIIAHNTAEDMLTRHPHFGVTPAAYLQLLRISGADLAFLPGWFGTSSMDTDELARAVKACSGPLGKLRPLCPVIAGGKRPEHVAEYVASVGSPDLMIIAASALDEHPEGLAEGARAFRLACD